MDLYTALVFIVPSLGTAGALLFGFTNMKRNNKKDIEHASAQGAIVLTELGHVKATVEGIRTEMHEQNKTTIDMLSRLTAVEESAKSAHKRIDRLEKNKGE